MTHSYNQSIKNLAGWFWDTKFKKLITDKRHSKALAMANGVRVPQYVEVPPSFVVKPISGSSSEGVVLIHNGRDARSGRPLLFESLVIGEDGQVPALNWRWFVFGGSVKMVQVDDGASATSRGYYSWPDWPHHRLGPS